MSYNIIENNNCMIHLDESLGQAIEVWGWDRNTKNTQTCNHCENINQIIHFVSV